jgi:hypothetical protein
VVTTDPMDTLTPIVIPCLLYKHTTFFQYQPLILPNLLDRALASHTGALNLVDERSNKTQKSNNFIQPKVRSKIISVFYWTIGPLKVVAWVDSQVTQPLPELSFPVEKD